ncbi:hypothetical protein Ddc_17499 [Ditylenchus destructor]|nr:hypothetical protein Ddc_17499 [Ditylenchus destructor]
MVKRNQFAFEEESDSADEQIYPDEPVDKDSDASDKESDEFDKDPDKDGDEIEKDPEKDGDEIEKDSVEGDAEKDGDDQLVKDGQLDTDEPNLDGNEKENDAVSPDQAVKTPASELNGLGIGAVQTPVSALKQLGIDSVQKPSSSTPLSSKPDRKPKRPASGKVEEKQSADQEEFEKRFVSDLTPTSKLKALISGRPATDIKLRVVGYTVLYQTKNSQRFQVYLANAHNFAMRLTAWGPDAILLSKRVMTHSKVHLNNLEVRKYWKPDDEVNITSSEYEFHFSSPNSKVVQVLAVPSLQLSKLNVDYPQPNKFPPYWRVFSNLQGFRDRYLSGHAVILQSFEEYMFAAGKHTPPMQGVYGIVGDKSKTKVAMFVKANYHEVEELLEDMTQGVEFHFQDASVSLRGGTLWLHTDYKYCVAIPSSSDHNMGLPQDPDDYIDWSTNGTHSAKRKTLDAAHGDVPDDPDDAPTTSKKRGLYL